MIEQHRLMLADTVRNDAFYEALKEVVVPGETTVSDIGAGTGILSFMASKLGAKHCHLYELNKEVSDLSQQIAKESGIENCTFHHTNIMDVEDPEKTDIVVCELLGSTGLDEGILRIMDKAQECMKEGGTIIPHSLDLFVCPVVSDRIQQTLDIWDIGYDIDFSPAKQKALRRMFAEEVREGDLLQDGIQKWDSLIFANEKERARKADLSWEIHQDAILYGYALWWECGLTKNVRLSTSPLESQTHWKQVYLPLLEPIELKNGDSLHLDLSLDADFDDGIQLDWVSSVQTEDGEHLERSTMSTKRSV